MSGGGAVIADERSLVHRLAHAVRRGRRVALVLGSGLTATVVPGVPRMLDLADEFAARVVKNPDLASALAHARAATPDRPAETYAAYRRTFTAWVSPEEFDIIVQRAVLEAYRPASVAEPTWERIGFQRGEQLERDLDAWRLPDGVAALGAILASLPRHFGYRVLTTNFDPLIEVAVRRAGGRARSLSLLRDGSFGALVVEEGTVGVIHLHGYWRPTSETDQRALLHDPEQLNAYRPTLSRELADVLRDETVCVVGYSGWDDVFTQALYHVSTGRDVDVLWALHARPEEAAPPPPSPADPAQLVHVYRGVDSNRLFTQLRQVLAVEPPADRPAAPAEEVRLPAAESSGHRVRQRELENHLGAEASADELLRELDRRFGWQVDRSPGVQLALLFWPAQLRQPTLIYCVQALVAAALSARGVRVVLCLDDLAPIAHRDEVREVFVNEVERWFDLVDGAQPPHVESLLSFCAPERVAERLLDPELLLRPTHPWAVEYEYYSGERRIYDVVRSAKAVPDVEAEQADPIEVTTRLTTTRADRLVSTPAIWAHLHYLLRDIDPDAVLTLGGEDEATMWRYWHETFSEPVCHLYNPLLANIRQDAAILRERSFAGLRRHLDATCRLPGWDEEGRYLHWTVQNAVLLGRYLRNRPTPAVGQHRLDSWPAVARLLRDPVTRQAAIQVLAREISSLFLHETE
jgi:hypothetical protein